MRSLRLLSVGLPALILAVGALTFSSGHENAPQVEAQGVVDFSIAVDGGGCDTKGVNPTRCKVAAGGQFTVIVSINDVSLGYRGMQVRLNYSAGVMLKQRAGTSEVVWPDCSAAYEMKSAQEYLAGCATDPESVFTGQVVAVDFTCTAPGSETVTMVHGVPVGEAVGDTYIVDEFAGFLAEVGIESLTIHCVSVGGITELPGEAGAPPELPGEAEAPLEMPDSSGINAGVVAGIAAAVLAGTVSLGGAAWYARRRLSSR